MKFCSVSSAVNSKKLYLSIYLFSILSCQQDAVKHLVDLKRKTDELFMVASNFVLQKCVVSFPEAILDEFSE